MSPFSLQSPFAHPPSRREAQSLEFLATSTRIPESNARSEPWSAQEYAEAARKRRRLCTPRPTHHLPNPSAIPYEAQSHQNSRIVISKGVLQEGDHIILTHQHPAVSQCLAHIRKTYTLPPCTPETVQALCSIEVFLHPSDPAHWLFWSNERKNETLDVLNRICDVSPPLIQPSRTWSESMLYSLPQLHGQAWHDILRDEPWYATLVGGRASDTPSRGPNLRKRKAPVEAHVEISPDAPAPATKRLRAQRSHPTKPAAELSSEATEASSSTPATQPNLPSGSTSVLSSRRNSARPIRKPAKFTDPDWSESSSRSSSTSPLASNVLLPLAVEPEADAEPESGSRRDSSSSARTLVGSASSSRASSPMSDLTTITLVEAESVSCKTKARKGKGTNPSASTSRTKAPLPTKGKETETPARMMTRARTRVRVAS